MLAKCFKAALKPIIKTIVAIMNAALIACWVVPYAYEQRGYTAIGGEALLVLTTFVFSLWFLSRNFKKIFTKFRKGEKGMLRCINCGRMISFVKRKGQKSVPVEPHAEYFVPDETTGTAVFVTEKGMVRKGRPSADGLKGYVLHKCDRKRGIT